MNNIIVISGPSGSGKSTLVKKITHDFSKINFATSHTTRIPRATEIDGQDYYFISKKKFLKMINNNEFIEWAEVHNNLYGTTKQEINKKALANDFVILDIDVQGVKILQRKIFKAQYIFIIPPSVDELRKRLQQRPGDELSNINLRLKIALEEIKKIELYDYVILNNDLSSAYSNLKSILIANTHKVIYNKDKIKDIFKF